MAHLNHRRLLSNFVPGMGSVTRKSILLIRDSVIVPRSTDLLVSLACPGFRPELRDLYDMFTRH